MLYRARCSGRSIDWLILLPLDVLLACSIDWLFDWLIDGFLMNLKISFDRVIQMVRYFFFRRAWRRFSITRKNFRWPKWLMDRGLEGMTQRRRRTLTWLTRTRCRRCPMRCGAANCAPSLEESPTPRANGMWPCRFWLAPTGAWRCAFF